MIDRRSFIAETVRLGAVAGAASLHRPRTRRGIKAVAFDGFAVFDATAVVSTAEAIVPGRGRELVAAWRARHFDYQWLRTLGGKYADFQTTAQDALRSASRSLGLPLSESDRQRLVTGQAMLRPWPGAEEAIRSLREAGIRVALLSNMTESMLVDGLARARLSADVEHVLSTDRVRAAKPSPTAYAMGTSAFGLSRDEIAFVAFAGWDVAGAAWFGYPTAWHNPSGAPMDELDVSPRVTAPSLAPIARWIVQV